MRGGIWDMLGAPGTATNGVEGERSPSGVPPAPMEEGRGSGNFPVPFRVLTLPPWPDELRDLERTIHGRSPSDTVPLAGACYLIHTKDFAELSREQRRGVPVLDLLTIPVYASPLVERGGVTLAPDPNFAAQKNPVLGCFPLLESPVYCAPEPPPLRCSPKCPHCLGQGWVCEDHPDKPWAPVVGSAGCPCGAAGVECQYLALLKVPVESA